ncbi:UDP-N-acetylglucosamine 2-epimerase [bioreactor metagenome]|uniref:UDP-N-acetylglucosamine 2-epimerase (non-hydrolyzing) n=1 Tax=bioreactor metagenome TaxID=1076179 RepID=A0A644U6R7_9ZZZZ|nr:UDP-N-acetylglucosamine 2-epimerase (non-hydrolyzing) [Methanocorpusculum sp.]
MKIMSIFGTRPEAIKMCPLIKELQKHPEIENRVCLTGQHREMLQSVMGIFGVHSDYNLDIMRTNQTLSTITVDILEKIENILIQDRPDIILVHGDTTTSFVSALAAFYQQIPVGHVEAGLRTHNKYSPYPEEMNRSLTGKIADIHFAPTVGNKLNLMQENITKNVFVTGNTVIDAFAFTLKNAYLFDCDALNKIDYSTSKVILVTAHRRENVGQPLLNICEAITKIVSAFENVVVIYPVHPNPVVRKTIFSQLSHVERVLLLDPLDVSDMHNLMARSYLVLTDSGGLQEEAPACGIPVLVMRTETERPEAVEAGTVKVVGIQSDDIFEHARVLLMDNGEYNKMAKAVNPYGDGTASLKIVQILLDWFANRLSVNDAESF